MDGTGKNVKMKRKTNECEKGADLNCGANSFGPFLRSHGDVALIQWRG